MLRPSLIFATHHGQVVQARDLIFEVVNPSKLLIEALAYDSSLSKNIADGKVDVNGKVIELKYLGGGQTLREQALPLTFSAKSDDLQFLPIGQPIRVFVNTDSKITGVKAPSKSLVKSKSLLKLFMRPYRMRLKQT